MTPGFLISRSVEKVKKFRSGLGLNIKHKGRRVKSLYLPLRCKWPTDNYDQSSYCITSLNLIICYPRLCLADPGFVIIMYMFWSRRGVIEVQSDGQTWILCTRHRLYLVWSDVWQIFRPLRVRQFLRYRMRLHFKSTNRIHISKRLSLFTHLISIWEDGRQVCVTIDLDTFRESQEFGTVRKSRWCQDRDGRAANKVSQLEWKQRAECRFNPGAVH